MSKRIATKPFGYCEIYDGCMEKWINEKIVDGWELNDVKFSSDGEGGVYALVIMEKVFG